MPAAIRIMARSEINEGSASMCQKSAFFLDFANLTKKTETLKMLRLFRLEKSVKKVGFTLLC